VLESGDPANKRQNYNRASASAIHCTHAPNSHHHTWLGWVVTGTGARASPLPLAKLFL